MAVVDDAPGFPYFVVVITGVSAAHADAVLVAEPPFRKALAVQFQAVNLGALAARVGLLPGGQVQLRYEVYSVVATLLVLLLHDRDRVLIQQAVEQVPVFEAARHPVLNGLRPQELLGPG